jgi:hypothetical protein
MHYFIHTPRKLGGMPYNKGIIGGSLISVFIICGVSALWALTLSSRILHLPAGKKNVGYIIIGVDK